MLAWRKVASAVEGETSESEVGNERGGDGRARETDEERLTRRRCHGLRRDKRIAAMQ